jgi:DNA-3-methyladenine glycosylase
LNAAKTIAPLPALFFQRDAATVARELVGCRIVRAIETARAHRVFIARIVETEAYVGTHDLACHASKGRTKRTEVMFQPGGRAYVYFIYGMHEMLNVVTGTGDGQAVLLRAAEPLAGFPPGTSLSGPAKLTRAMHITRVLNGIDLTTPALHFLPREKGDRPTIRTTPRINVDYARHWQHEPLRFIDTKSSAISRP